MGHWTSAQKQYIISVVNNQTKEANKESYVSDPFAHGLSRVLQCRNGQKEQAKGEKHRRESPECKAMFSRNAVPPVCSCNFTGNSPKNCLTRRDPERCGEIRWIWWEGEWDRDSERKSMSEWERDREKWVEDKMSCTNHRSFFKLSQFRFMYPRQYFHIGRCQTYIFQPSENLQKHSWQRPLSESGQCW